MTAPKFTKIAPGAYATKITLANGAVRGILVKKIGAPNLPTPLRGDTHTPAWVAYSGPLNLEVQAKTRGAALDAAIAELITRGRVAKGA